MRATDRITRWPLKELVAAVSVGIVEGQPVLDLPYVEDSDADVDMNVVMTASGSFVEIQGTAESATFDDAALQAMLGLARKGVKELVAAQRRALGLDA
jgi:ribonuclease PH